jgi:adenosylcobinamide kinase / adenosylcobinamide-phosphate guanylyltransferase
VETASSLIFITGGVRSGKSSFAEKIAMETADEKGGQLWYLATGVSSDLEMKERIEKHKRDREKAKFQWKTLERSVQISGIANQFNGEDIVLLDCVTTLLNNELFTREQEWNELLLEKVKESIISGIIAIRNRAKNLIVVSNEVLHEPLSGNEMVLTYGKLLGQIHQRLVSEADQAYLIEASIPIIMKGAKQ